MARKTFITCPDTNKLSLLVDCHRCRKLIQANYRLGKVECVSTLDKQCVGKHGEPHRFAEMLTTEDVT